MHADVRLELRERWENVRRREEGGGSGGSCWRRSAAAHTSRDVDIRSELLAQSWPLTSACFVLWFFLKGFIFRSCTCLIWSYKDDVTHLVYYIHFWFLLWKEKFNQCCFSSIAIKDQTRKRLVYTGKEIHLPKVFAFHLILRVIVTCFMNHYKQKKTWWFPLHEKGSGFHKVD